jgi:hypothetical protein
MTSTWRFKERRISSSMIWVMWRVNWLAVSGALEGLAWAPNNGAASDLASLLRRLTAMKSMTDISYFLFMAFGR